MSVQKTTKYCSGVQRRVGSGFGNPIIAALMPIATQLFVGLIGRMRCLQPKPEVEPVTPQEALAAAYNRDPQGTIRRGIPEMKKAFREAGRRECRLKGQRYRAADYALEDEDARHLVIANIQETIGMRPQDVNDLVGYVQTSLGNEPVAG